MSAKELEEFEMEMDGIPMPEEPIKPYKKKKEDKVYYSADFKELCDLVNVNGEAKFYTYSGEVTTEAEVNGKTYNPPKMEKLAYDLPKYQNVQACVTELTGVSGVSEYQGVSFEESLFNEILEYHKESAELPDERLYILITAWDIHTHLLEKFGHSPIIFFAGLPEKGKSRMATSMLNVARRGVRKASVSDAQIIREASDQGATIFFDMTNFWASIQKSGSEDVVLSRFERGLKVARVLNPDKGAFEDMTYFNVFGPTIIASNDTIENVLGSRTVSIVMRQAKKKFENLVDEEKGKLLRDKLVALRFKHNNTKLPSVNKIVGGRFGDIIKPLHQIVKFIKPSVEDDFVELIKELDHKRQSAKSSTLEGEIIQSIIDLENEVTDGILPVKLITNKLNTDKNEREKVTYQRIGRKLDIMGYQKAKTGNGSSAIIWNADMNHALALEHGVVELDETPRTPVTQETSETPVTSKEEDIDIIGVANDIFNNDK